MYVYAHAHSHTHTPPEWWNPQYKHPFWWLAEKADSRKNGKQGFSFTGQCSINIRSKQICRGPLCFREVTPCVYSMWLGLTSTLKEVFHPQPADGTCGCWFLCLLNVFCGPFMAVWLDLDLGSHLHLLLSSSNCFLLSRFFTSTIPSLMYTVWQFVFVQYIQYISNSFAPRRAQCCLFKAVLSLFFVLYYLTISTLFHCHHRPDTTGDEKDLREILLRP